MTLDQISHAAQTWGLLLLMGVFFAAVAYALRPSNKASFDAMARLPLVDRDDEAEQGNG